MQASGDSRSYVKLVLVVLTFGCQYVVVSRGYFVHGHVIAFLEIGGVLEDGWRGEDLSFIV